jgi:hypothetical protein
MIELLKKEPSLKFVIPVLKWLKNPESVSKDKLMVNYRAAYRANAADAAYTVAAYATYDAADAAYWTGKYFENVSITHEEVEAELFKVEQQLVSTNDEHDDIRVMPEHAKTYVNRKTSQLQRAMSEGAYANEVIEALQKIIDKLKADRV